MTFLVFSLLAILCMCFYISLLGEFSAIIATLLGEVSWKFEAGFSWIYTPFSFSDFKLYIFIVLNHNGEYIAFLSSEFF